MPCGYAPANAGHDTRTHFGHRSVQHTTRYALRVSLHDPNAVADYESPAGFSATATAEQGVPLVVAAAGASSPAGRTPGIQTIECCGSATAPSRSP
jgi:hypothetical protein